ncbi:acyl-CoA-binding domain-containing protein [Streptomyces leeuwenhoekii]|uniref:ACB domain-containing protein n=1 Tax=Streptomyces leeuwenhoekii TaxID=1437453 RepID=A0A0F7VNU1_STRLW|nr:acyl-CoA-binding protein [Streptomyces leeuwenhoekii]CQR61819.1 Hypothetical Protein sle_23580 [Streptomyces leeuwenhoekii]
MSVGLDNPEFAQAAENIKRLTDTPDTDTRLKLYAYFQQAIIGDASTHAPAGTLDFAAKAKWHAWNEVRGMDQSEATLKYIELAKAVLQR